MADGREEINERDQNRTIDVAPSMGKILEVESENRGRGSGGRRGTLAALPGFGKILGGDKEHSGGRGGRRATLYDISALGSAFANLRGINNAALTLGDQKVTFNISKQWLDSY